MPDTREALIEAMAKAWYSEFAAEYFSRTWEEASEGSRNGYRADVEHILHLAEAAGCVLMPKVATEAMKRAGPIWHIGGYQMETEAQWYERVLAASPFAKREG